MKRKPPAPSKSPLLNKIARKVGDMAGSIVHAGNALATTAAAIVETGRKVKRPKATRASAAAPVVKKKRNPQSAR